MTVDDSTARSELVELFSSAVQDHPDVMAECLSILRLYNLSPSTLFYKYEAFLLSRPSGLRSKLSVLTLDTVRELRKEIQREQQASAVATSFSSASSHTPGGDTPKTAMGMRKGKGGMADLGGFLDGLTTPSRPGKPRPTAVPSTLRKAAASEQTQSDNSSTRTPIHDVYSTPDRATPNAASSSSYRPAGLNIAPMSTNGHLTPIGRGAVRDGASSPVSGGESPAILTSQPTQPFHLRPQPHSLVETLNGHLPDIAHPPNSSKPRVELSSAVDPKDWNYRYMFEKISQRSEALDDAIDDFAEIIQTAYGVTELGDPHLPSEEPIYAVGRVLAPPGDAGKASAGALFLESSRLLGGGRRTALRMEQGHTKVRGGAPGVRSFGVFPGCVVCVKGKNGGGGAFLVDEVLLPPPANLSQTHVSELLEYQHGDRLTGQPISMMLAAGPFTLEDDLSYAPLEALVVQVIRERPDVLILLGPFVDSLHPFLVTGRVTQTPIEMFRTYISAKLARIAEASPGTYIILVPSTRDLVSRHIAFPQAMLEKEELGLPKRARCLPNPCTFSINEITIALSSVDVLFHLRREELSQRADEAAPDVSVPEVKDAMANLVRHVLGQRSFYPIFPPPEVYASEVNLDVTHYPLCRLQDAAPDILIMPSKLKHFSKIVDSTLVVNPAYLSRAHSAGTYAKLIIHPTPREKLENSRTEEEDGLEGMQEHGVWDRAKSEIWRI